MADDNALSSDQTHLAPQANAVSTSTAQSPDFDDSKPASFLAPDSDSNANIERGQTRKLTPSEVQGIIRLLADGVPQTVIAKKYGVVQSAISYLKSKYEPTVDAARALIQARSANVARQWLRSVPIAARKGDHRPARDWLTAAGVVAPEVSTGSSITINVGVGVKLERQDDGPDDPFLEAKVVTNE